MNILRELAKKHKANKIGKKGRRKYCYLDVYLELFTLLKDKPIDILEIGVSNGGSMRMWEDFFPNANIVGVDRKPKCTEYKSGRVKLYIGDQGDKEFLRSIPGEYDIVIDDGSHKNAHQKHTLKILFPRVKSGGLYIIEDLQTSYDRKYGGGFRGEKTMIEKLKQLVDEINWAWWLNKPESYMMEHLYSMAFYESLCVMRKK